MASPLRIPKRHSRRGEPTWEMLDIVPEQGDWDEDEYLALETNRQIEFTDGFLEVLPMPSEVHQMLALLLTIMLRDLDVGGRKGRASHSLLKLKMRAAKWRMPDVLYLAPESLHRYRNEWWDYADVVIEIVSKGSEDRKRDYVRKRRAYARAGIPEYWIVDPEERKITVLALEGEAYREAGTFAEGKTAQSVLLPNFTVDVAKLFADAAPPTP